MAGFGTFTMVSGTPVPSGSGEKMNRVRQKREFVVPMASYNSRPSTSDWIGLQKTTYQLALDGMPFEEARDTIKEGFEYLESYRKRELASYLVDRWFREHPPKKATTVVWYDF